MQTQNMLVIAPHADDEVLGCGGVMARAIDEGAHVEVCVVTQGAPQLFSEPVLKQIREEAVSVHRAMGIASTHFLEFPAPLLDQTANHVVSDAIRHLILAQKPDTVLIPHQGDIHHDHSVVYSTALVACRPLGESPVRRILAYETLSETEWAPPRGDTWFVPNTYVSIGQYLERKVEAMNGYASQVRQAPHPRSEGGIRALAAHRGYTVGVEAAEAFMLIREIA